MRPRRGSHKPRPRAPVAREATPHPGVTWSRIGGANRSRKPLTHLELGAVFRAAAHLHGDALKGAAAKLAVSFNHLSLTIAGDRVASAGLRARLANYCGLPTGAVPTTHRPGARIRK